ncbi:hypothetical protein [Streptomyces venezuelae]|uniref:hypothetical protein n=1 Tax=Streptomyces venezuelae TaxID=54571 RepID=UPI00343680EC
MRRNRISRLAARRRQYTGETYAQARAALDSHEAPLPAAHRAEQRNFEAEVFDAVLNSHSRLTETTFGIAATRPARDSLELEVENEERGDALMRRLLPFREPGADEIRGVPGLRITKRTSRGIELHISGQQTCLWLTGLSAKAWKRVENALLDGLQEMSWQSLWTTSYAWTAAEGAHEAKWNNGNWNKRMHAGAWLASGLLRRIPAFHCLIPAQTVTGYMGLGVIGYEGLGPVRWVLEVDFAHGRPAFQEGLTAALTDRDLGLPLSPARHLEVSQGGPLPPNILRFDDSARTGLVEFRCSTGMYSSLVRDHPETAERIERRVRRVLEQHPWYGYRPSAPPWRSRPPSHVTSPGTKHDVVPGALTVCAACWGLWCYGCSVGGGLAGVWVRTARRCTPRGRDGRGRNGQHHHGAGRAGGRSRVL